MRDLNAAIRNEMFNEHSRSSGSARRSAFFPNGPGARSGNACCTTAFALSFQGRSRAAVFRIHLIQLEKLSMRNDSCRFDIAGYFTGVPLLWESETVTRGYPERSHHNNHSALWVQACLIHRAQNTRQIYWRCSSSLTAAA